jgi:Prokaryotic N-terminal methylation motif
LKNSRGFSLFEIILILAVLSMVLGPLLFQFSKGLIASQEVKGTNLATILAQKKIEIIDNLPYASITSESWRTVEGFPLYQRNVTVIESPANLKDVKVTVSWIMEEGSTMYVTEETSISNF